MARAGSLREQHIPAASDQSAPSVSDAGLDRAFVVASDAMKGVCRALDAAARFDCTVLVLGESGVGKELAARRVHDLSPRREGPFIPVDCTTLSETIAESQLFGHVKGAFTGAEREAMGFLRAAEGGTLFLDEIGELSPSLQAKLLRCLQERAVTPMGGTSPVPINIRVVAATHRDLGAMVREGKFRQDLFYRINVVRMVLPPLRERVADVAPIARHFVKRLASLYGHAEKSIAPAAIAALEHYPWPGNVRELANAMEHAFIFAQGDAIEAGDLPDTIRPAAPALRADPADPPSGEVFSDTWLRADQPVVPLEVAERELIARALSEAQGVQSVAAAMLGLERRRLYRKVKTYGLESLTTACAGDGDEE